MALYEITQDCRIANIEYQKGDVISDTEVGGFYPSVMRPTKAEPKKAEKKEEVMENIHINEEEKVEVKKPTKKGRKK